MTWPTSSGAVTTPRAVRQLHGRIRFSFSVEESRRRLTVTSCRYGLRLPFETVGAPSEWPLGAHLPLSVCHSKAPPASRGIESRSGASLAGRHLTRIMVVFTWGRRRDIRRGGRRRLRVIYLDHPAPPGSLPLPCRRRTLRRRRHRRHEPAPGLTQLGHGDRRCSSTATAPHRPPAPHAAPRDVGKSPLPVSKHGPAASGPLAAPRPVRGADY